MDKESNGVGIPRVYASNKMMYFCRAGFTDREAAAFCLNHGYEEGGTLNPVSNNDAKIDMEQFNDKETKHEMVKTVECADASKTIDNQACSYTFDPQGCNPADTALVKCNGKLNEHQPPAVNLKPIGRLPYGKLAELHCGEDATFIKGDPGTVQLVNCPKMCAENGASVIGVGIFDSASSICKSALLSGVIFNDLGGLVQVTVSFPVLKSFKTQNNGVTSVENDPSISAMLRTFTVSKPNSCSAFMTAMEDAGGIIAN